jgi:hypothetical protein
MQSNLDKNRKFRCECYHWDVEHNDEGCQECNCPETPEKIEQLWWAERYSTG